MTAAALTAVEREEAPQRPFAIALVVAAAFFMENLDGTVITTALPVMADSFGRTAVDLSIGVTSYMLAMAVFIPISGWVADRFGPRSVFSSAIALFTLSSVLCGMSGSLTQFTLARVAQGAAGALMVPVGRMVVLRAARKDQLMRAIAYITWPGLAAPVLGPLVGGLLTDYASWRWIFFLNVPLGVAGFVAARRLIPAVGNTERRRFDTAGFVLSGLACTGLLYGTELVSQEHTEVAPYLGLIVVSVAVGAVGVWHLLRTAEPLLDLRTLRLRTFAVPMGGGSLFRLAIGGTPFLLPLLFQVGFGMTALRSGLLVLSVFAGNLLMKPATTPLLRRFGFRRVLIVNGLLAAVSVAACALFTAGTPEWVIVAVLFAGGLIRSMQFSAQITMTYADVPQREMSSASTLSSIVIQLSLAMGVACGALIVRLFDATGLGGDGAATPFRLAFVAMGLIALFGVLDARSLAPDAGAEVSGHRPR